MNSSKKSNALWGFGVIVAILAVLMFLSWPKGNNASTPAPVPTSGSGTLMANETMFDFGRISMAAGKVKRDYVVKNTSSELVTITKLYTSCMCTQATITAGTQAEGPFGMPGHSGIPRIKVTLSPGEEAIITAIFDPAAHGPAGVGPIDRVVYVENSSGKTVELGFQALVT